MVETGEDGTVARASAMRRRWRVRHAAGACLSLALLAMICGLGALVVVLGLGRINLDAFRPTLVAALQQRLGPGYQLEIGALAVERQDHGIALALDGLTVTASGGQRLITAPRADLIFDALSLLAGRIKPTRVELDDLAVQLRVRPDGGIDLRAGAQDVGSKDNAPDNAAAPEPVPEPPADPNKSVAEPTSAPAPATRAKVLRQAMAALNSIFDIAEGVDSPIAALDHFGVRRGRLVIDDRAAGQTRGFDDFEFALDRTREGGKGAAHVKMSARGQSGRWSVRGAARGARGEPHDLTIEASGFSIDEIALLAGKTSLPIDSDIPISLKASASFEGDGHVLEGNARLALGAGFWRFDDPDFAPLFVDEVFAAAHWDASAHRAVIEEAQVFSGPTRFFLNGAITPPSGDAAPWSVSFRQSEPCLIGPDRAGEKTVALTAIHGDVSVDPKARTLTINRTEVVGPEVAVAAQGTIDWTAGPHIRMGIAASKTSASAALALWPNNLGAPARGWVGDHLLSGTLESMRAAIDLDDADLKIMRADHAPMDDRMTVDYVIKDASFSFLDDAPPVVGLSGQGRSTGRTTRITATGGALEAGPGRRIELSDGVYSMPDLETKPLAVSVTARGKGTLDALGEVLSRPGFAKVVNLPLDPKTTKGNFDGTFTWRTRLAPVYDPHAESMEVVAKIDNFSAEHLVGKEKLEQGALNVTLDKGVTHITGTGRLYGGPAVIDLTRSGPEPAQGTVSFVMDDAARAKAGLNFGAGVTGPVLVKAVGEPGVAHPSAKVDMDLTRTALNYPIPGLFKPAGRPGKVAFAYREDERGLASLENIVFDGGGPTAKGAMQMGADGALNSARFGQVKFSPGDNMQIDVSRAGETMKIAVKGAAIDARPFLKSLATSNEAGKSDKSDFDLDLNASLLSGANRQIISNAELRLARKAGQIQTLSFSGKLGGDAVQGALFRVEGGAPVLRVSTSDGGALLAFLDLYSHMEGGKLECALRLGDNGVSGPLDVENFILRGEPAMRSFASAPAGEELAAKIKLDPDVVAFARMHAVLNKSGGRLSIRDGTISSPSIGSTLEGTVDFDRDALDLSGVFVPAYGVNNLFGKIPGLGLVLGGGAQEGLIGLNYRVTGKTTAPVLSVNPLSAIAPGFLRKIFGVLPSQ